MVKLSVVLAVRNEEENIGRCLDSVKRIADEIIIFDEYSTDKTVEIAQKYGAKVFEEQHHDIFHITKQKAIDKASGEWILQMDADEVITADLGEEIKKVINMTEGELLEYKSKMLQNPLFRRHEAVIEKRDGKIDKNTGEVVAFFIPRLNMFLGKPLRYAGVYPDPAIRLIKKGKAYLPGKSVHEIMKVEGEIAWLKNSMEHYDSPTLSRYITRLNRYTDLHADELKVCHAPKNIFYLLYYCLIKAKLVFIKLFVRHRGYKDGLRGFLWSAFSAWHYPIAYFKYWTSK